MSKRLSLLWEDEIKLVWRGAALWLLVVAILGPWVAERINVPAEFTCSFPSFRLEGDFCGVPLSGLWMLRTVASEFFDKVVRLNMGVTVIVDMVTGLRFFLGAPLIVLPFFSTLFLIITGNRYPEQMFNLAAWGLAAVISLLIGISSYSRFYWALWGIWLYLGVATSTLVLEILTLVAARRSMLGQGNRI